MNEQNICRWPLKFSVLCLYLKPNILKPKESTFTWVMNIVQHHKRRQYPVMWHHFMVWFHLSAAEKTSVVTLTRVSEDSSHTKPSIPPEVMGSHTCGLRSIRTTTVRFQYGPLPSDGHIFDLLITKPKHSQHSFTDNHIPRNFRIL